VKHVIEEGDRLDLEVELVGAPAVARAAGASRSRSRTARGGVRDLPLAGRVTNLVWHKRRYACRERGRTFTESHRELPARQRVTRRFRRRLFERVRWRRPRRGGAL
jgi:transposase